MPVANIILILTLGVATLVTCAPDTADKLEARDIPDLGRRSFSDSNVADRNPILEYLLSPSHSRNQIPPGGKREFSVLQVFPSTTHPPKRQPVIITAPPKTTPFQRDPNKSPLENFTGYILAGRKPEDNLVNSPPLTISEGVKNDNRTFTKVNVIPATATIVNTYNEHGKLTSSFTRYEPAAGNSFSLSSLVEYGPDADICSKSDAIKAEDKNFERKAPKILSAITKTSAALSRPRRELRYVPMDQRRQNFGFPEHYSSGFFPTGFSNPYSLNYRPRWMDDQRSRKTTRLTVADSERGLATIRIENPISESDEPKLTVRKGGVSIAGPGGYATAYSGGTAVVGPYGTVFKSPEGVVVAGPHSKIINITDSTSFAEILRMYEASKANKTSIGRSLKSLVSPNKQTEIDNSRERDIGGDYAVVNKLFSFKSTQPASLVSQGGLQRARKFSRTIDRSSGKDKFTRRNSRRNYNHPIEQTEMLAQYRAESKEEWDRLLSETKQDFGAENGETTLVFAPKTRAEAGKDGVAVSSPVSYAEIHPGQNVHLVFQPQASAQAGPGGFAHAHSDLFVRYIKRKGSTTTDIPMALQNK